MTWHTSSLASSSTGSLARVCAARRATNYHNYEVATMFWIVMVLMPKTNSLLNVCQVCVLTSRFQPAHTTLNESLTLWVDGVLDGWIVF